MGGLGAMVRLCSLRPPPQYQRPCQHHQRQLLCPRLLLNRHHQHLRSPRLALPGQGPLLVELLMRTARHAPQVNLGGPAMTMICVSALRSRRFHPRLPRRKRPLQCPPLCRRRHLHRRLQQCPHQSLRHSLAHACQSVIVAHMLGAIRTRSSHIAHRRLHLHPAHCHSAQRPRRGPRRCPCQHQNRLHPHLHLLEHRIVCLMTIAPPIRRSVLRPRTSLRGTRVRALQAHALCHCASGHRLRNCC